MEDEGDRRVCEGLEDGAVRRGEGDGADGRIGVRIGGGIGALDEEEDVPAPGDAERGVVCGIEDPGQRGLQVRQRRER